MPVSVIADRPCCPEPWAKAATIFAIIDRQDAAAFADAFDREGVFIFGNAEPVVGHAAIEAAVSAFFGVIRSLRHDLHDVWQIDDTVISRLTVTYTRYGGTIVSLPAATIWREKAGLITDYRIYADLAPLFARAG